MKTLPMWFVVLLCSCGQGRPLNNISVDKYLHDESWEMARTGHSLKLPLSDIYVLKTNSRGRGGQIFPEDLRSHEVIFHSSDPTAIGTFTELVGHDAMGRTPEPSKGATFHVLLK